VKEEAVSDLSATGRVISRPRLTDALERTSSRVIALVAPAGYGKTTLAREWVASSGRTSAWYGAGPGSSDVAALAAGLADAIATLVPGAREDLRQRLKSTRDPEAEALALSEMIARHLASWPEDAWLVIDDYQYIAQAEIAEILVERVADAPNLKLLVASRLRPRWATPRKLIYGEILELNRSSLAMTSDETAEVVGEHRSDAVAGLLALAEGWPAVIGLAAHIDEIDFTEGARLTQNLYDFFAEELFQAAAPQLRDGLYQMALLGGTPLDATQAIFPHATDDALTELEHLGFVTADAALVTMHPLLRTFLFGKLQQTASFEPALDQALRRLLSLHRWDDAFELIETFDVSQRLYEVVEHGLYEILSSGRLPTVERWTKFARAHRLDGGLVDLLEAEILFRRGDWAESQRLGSRAAHRLPAGHPLRAQAFYRAGQSAQFGDRLGDALKHHGEAKVAATTESDRAQALWGLFITQSEMELIDDALLTLAEFESTRTGSVEDDLRILGSHLTMWVRVQGVGRARDLAKRAERLLEHPCDPVVRCGFYQMLAITLSLAGEYNEALRIADLELAEARHNLLSFVLPHAYTSHALANLGLRRFRNAESYIDEIDQAASAQDDLHSRLNAAALKTRLHLAQGETQKALRAIEISFDRRPSPGMLADFLSTKGLALGCAGEARAALATVDEASSISRQIETRVQCAAVRAIVAIDTGRANDSALKNLIGEVESTGNVDGLICAYRGFPALLQALVEARYRRLPQIVRMAGDKRLAQKAGLATHDAESASTLTRRESQVYELLKEGRTNREIAQSLWISEKTAKVHVHHILEKLGARSRTEAVLKDWPTGP
jgi:ATP/maltotriose-dependent transcriptional regulator MalT